MDWKLFFQLLVTVSVALTVGWLGHRFAARRDLLNERRKLRVAYLLEAYKKIENAGNRSDPDSTWPLLESAIADIQLLGSPAQVELARRFALDMAQHSTASLDPLVNDLRNSLRNELELSKVQQTVTYLRFAGSEAVSFDQTLGATIRSVNETKIEQAAVASPDSRNLLEKQKPANENTIQIMQAWSDLESLLRERLEDINEEGASELGAAALLKLALQAGVITDVQHRSLRGLNTMRNLAVHGRDSEVDVTRVREFLDLADAMKVVLEITDVSETSSN
ncbi:MAG: hypothetical protein KDJ16_06410 [Hyphomicrobiales bacterium]|nr:hypothetical protein [Hyphomicrobiales bacterium]